MKSMTAQERNNMLLNDPVSRVIPKLAIPTIISMLITNVYNMADTFFVSQIGTSASGAVGVIFSAMAIIQAFSFMIGMAPVRTSVRLSAQATANAPTRYASTAFFTAFLVGILLCVREPDAHRRHRPLPRLNSDHRALCQGIRDLHFLCHAVYDVFLRHEQPAPL